MLGFHKYVGFHEESARHNTPLHEPTILHEPSLEKSEEILYSEILLNLGSQPTIQTGLEREEAEEEEYVASFVITLGMCMR